MRAWRIAVTGGESSDAKVSEVFAHFGRNNTLIFAQGDFAGPLCVPHAELLGWAICEYPLPASTPLACQITDAAIVNDGFDILVVFRKGAGDLDLRAQAAGRQILWAEGES